MSIFDYASQTQPEPQPIPPEQLEETTLIEPVYVTIVCIAYNHYYMQLKCYVEYFYYFSYFIGLCFCFSPLANLISNHINQCQQYLIPT
jgi:hypothetical protein